MPLPNVTSKILAKVIEYAKFHVDKPAAAAGEAATEAAKEPGDEAKAWNAEFVKVDQGTLFELILVRSARTGAHAGWVCGRRPGQGDMTALPEGRHRVALA